MSKAYNIIEVLNMEEGTKFKAITPSGDKYDVEVKESKYNSNKILYGFNFTISDFVANTKFYKIPQAITFEEALESGKKLRLNESYDFSGCEEDSSGFLEQYLNGCFLSLDEIFFLLSNYFSGYQFRQVFLEKCWYIEE